MEADSDRNDTFSAQANIENGSIENDNVDVIIKVDDDAGASSNDDIDDGEENETQATGNAAPCVTNFSISEILRPTFGKKSKLSGKNNAWYTIDRTETHDKDGTILNRVSETRKQDHNQSLLFDFRCFRYAGFHGFSAFSKVCMSKNVSDPESTKHSQKPRTSVHSNVSKSKHFQIRSKQESDMQKALDKSKLKPDSREKSPPGREARSPNGVTSPGPAEPGPKLPSLWPAWVYCTRYSDRPSSGPRSRKVTRRDKRPDEKRPRTAFTSDQLQRLRSEFERSRYLTEQRRRELAAALNLSEAQIKIWYQNKRAKIKKSSGGALSPLAAHLTAQGLYNHKTTCISGETRRDC